jgi:RAT1-interacting protein
MIKYWAQSFLANVPKVVVGFRDDEGIIKDITTYNTLKIPKEVDKSLWVIFYLINNY